MTPADTLLSAPSVALVPFVDAGLFNQAEIQAANMIERLAVRSGNAAPPEVILAVALAARGTRSGHVCIELDKVADLIGEDLPTGLGLPWPEHNRWKDALANATSLVATPDTASQYPVRPLVVDGNRLYLQRYWVAEKNVADSIISRIGATGTLAYDQDKLQATLDRMFGPEYIDGELDLQRRGAATALTNTFSVLAGGPGTGKTRTIARMLAVAMTLAAESAKHVHVALAAPSGKAAARMGEAIEGAVDDLLGTNLIDDHLAGQIRSVRPTTIHALLGANPRRGFSHNASNPLRHDMVVIDETSMVSLPLMAALLEAVGPTCHVVLVGDPDQLASVQAGTVLGDIVRPSIKSLPSAQEDTPAGASLDTAGTGSRSRQITILKIARRFSSGSRIAALAESVRAGDTDATIQLLSSAGSDGTNDSISWVEPNDDAGVNRILDTLVENGHDSVKLARDGDAAGALAALSSTKLLAATHHFPLGLIDWSDRIETGIFTALGPDSAPPPWHRWYVGRPVMVTRNDRLLRISNGDVGVTVERDGVLVVAIDGNPQDPIEVQTARLEAVDTWWAMTIHKSQGSEFDHVIVSLPPANVPILTRELLYTAITRARSGVTIIGTEDAIRCGVDRPVSRASGLADRLWPALATAT